MESAMSQVALITGVAGQDGSYLAELLLEKQYEVHGADVRVGADALASIRHLKDRIVVHRADLKDQSSLENLIREVRPTEVYNLAAQSSVGQSWDQTIVTGEVTGLGVARLLKAAHSVNPSIRFFQAGSSEMFGKVNETPQRETTPFHPRNPYGVAKVYGHWITVNYRQCLDMFACSGILFNHESPRRGLRFVTRKITHAVAKIKLGLADELRLGNLKAIRDWGYAGDYVRAMWSMLQQDESDDYVIGTGEAHSVQEFVETAFSHVGLDWREHVTFDSRFDRRADADLLLADSSKAREKLDWRPDTSFARLVETMVDADMKLLQGGPELGAESTETTLPGRTPLRRAG